MAEHRLTLPTGVSGVPVIEGEQYTGLAKVTPLVNPRDCKITLRWYNGIGTHLQDDVGASTTAPLATITPLSVLATAPPDAEFASVRLTAEAVAGGDEFLWDEMAIMTGDNEAWLIGGLGASGFGFIIERSGDGGLTWVYVRGASLNSPLVPSPIANPSSELIDYEAPFNTSLLYRARSQIGS